MRITDIVNKTRENELTTPKDETVIQMMLEYRRQKDMSKEVVPLTWFDRLHAFRTGRSKLDTREDNQAQEKARIQNYVYGYSSKAEFFSPNRRSQIRDYPRAQSVPPKMRP